MSAARPLLLAGLLVACQPAGPAPTRQRRATAAFDSATHEARSPACPVPAQGCCEGETLWWCEGGLPKSLSCRDRPYCGWSNAGFYDCNTSGAGDPSGQAAKRCPGDSRVREAGRSCLGVPREGCCAGQVLFFCEDGELRSLSCGLNPYCGWKPGSLIYDCGSKGGSAPPGNPPRECPAGLPDSGPLPEAQADTTTARDRGAADAGDGGTKPGCSCQSGPPAPGMVTCALLLAVVLLSSRGRRQRSDRRRRRRDQVR